MCDTQSTAIELSIYLHCCNLIKVTRVVSQTNIRERGEYNSGRMVIIIFILSIRSKSQTPVDIITSEKPIINIRALLRGSLVGRLLMRTVTIVRWPGGSAPCVVSLMTII